MKEPTLKIYLAGKITGTTWRSELVCIPEMFHPSIDITSGFPVTEMAIESECGEVFDYTGPYFLSVQHKPASEPDTHGLLSEELRTMADAAGYGDEHSPTSDRTLQRQVAAFCMNAIDEADVVFAWIDSPDVYGTIAEIGFAKARGKQIWIGWSSEFAHRSDLWFIESLAHSWAEGSTPLEAFRDASRGGMPYLLRQIPYDEYLNTAHWSRVRDRALEFALGRCQVCYSGEHLAAHHRTYIRRGWEAPADVTILCSECHALFHKVVNGKPTRMPKAA